LIKNEQEESIHKVRVIHIKYAEKEIIEFKFNKKYVLKKFKSEEDKDFKKAIKMYKLNMPKHLYASENEIVYWLKHDDEQRKIYNLGLFLNEEIVGYLHLAYFISKKIMFLDYIVIEKDYKKTDLFFIIFDMLDKYNKYNHIHVDFIATEVLRYIDVEGKTEEESHLIKRFQACGFERLNYLYYQLPLGVEETKNIEAIILIKGYDKDCLKFETYMNFVKLVFYEHYIKWYKPFLTEEEFASYIRNAEKIYNKILKTENTIVSK
jgi:hypothetical protein